MSDKAEKKPEAAAAKKAEEPKPAAAKSEKPAGAGGGLLTSLPVLLGGVMVIEAAVLFAGFKLFAGGAQHANAADLTTLTKKDSAEGAEKGADESTSVEMDLVAGQFPNRQTGKTVIYDVQITLSAKKEFGDRVKKTLADHDALIKDRIRTIIAEADPDKLGGGSEPGLETLKRQIKYQLDEIVGDGQIQDIFVPKCISFRTD